MEIDAQLTEVVTQGGSDLHLTVGEPPIIRIDGDLHKMEGEQLTQEELEKLLKNTMSETIQKQFDEKWEVDYSYEIPEVARFRVNVYRQNRGVSAAFRIIPNKAPTLEELELPEIFTKLCEYKNGLILVTGPTGSGKSTTLSAMINYINQFSGRRAHIITIEDPIEFVYENHNCIINQRELGKDTQSFPNALRSALREDPDVILIGEMRDPESIHLALTAAETGHLVFATLHTNSAPKTIDRIVDSFEGGIAATIRTILSETLRAVVTQTLLKRPGGGRIAAHEILIANPAIRNLIREQKISQMYSTMQTSKSEGMHTLEQNIEELKAAGKIE